MKKCFNIRCDLLISLFLVVTIIAVYGQTGHYDFVDFDDDFYVRDNPHIRDGLTPESVIWAFTTGRAANWHPLTWLSHMLDIELYGMNPGQHHLSNVLFHIANTLLLFFVFRRMTGDLWPSAFVAALFALHPLHVESVAWISERKDVLSTFFWLLTMWAYARYAEIPNQSRYLITLLFFALGLMSKPMLITLPFVLLLLDFWPLGRWLGTSRVSALIKEKIPFFVITAASVTVTFLVQKKGGAVGMSDVYPLGRRIANALISYADYLGKMVWPSELTFFYPYPHVLSLWKLSAACVVIASVSLFVVRKIRQVPCLAVGWLWYMGTLVPVIGLVQIGGQSMADRYTYVPLIGIFIMMSWGIPDFAAKWRYGKQFLAATAIFILSILTVLSGIQTRYWADSVTLFEHALEVSEDNVIAHNNLGAVLHRQGRTEEAIPHYKAVLKMKPYHADAHNNLGSALAKQGKTGEAIQHYMQALRSEPGSASAHTNMGDILTEQGKSDQALRHYTEALNSDPNFVSAHRGMGVLFLREKSFDKAIRHFRKALETNPDDAAMHNNLGAALFRKGNIRESVFHFQHALKINPNYSPARNNLRNLMEALRRKNGDEEQTSPSKGDFQP